MIERYKQKFKEKSLNNQRKTETWKKMDDVIS